MRHAPRGANERKGGLTVASGVPPATDNTAPEIAVAEACEPL